MDCELDKIGKSKKGHRYKCKWCQATHESAQPPERIHKPCPARPKVEGVVAPVTDSLPTESRTLLIGDRIKELTDALGIPQCGGCEARQKWLNKAHEWILKRWG